MAGQYKAKKLFTMGNQYYWETYFEYRGIEYTVEYSSGYTTIEKKPAYLQHKEAQARIDELIDHPVIKDKPQAGTFDPDAIWNLMGWE